MRTNHCPGPHATIAARVRGGSRSEIGKSRAGGPLHLIARPPTFFPVHVSKNDLTRDVSVFQWGYNLKRVTDEFLSVL